MDEKDTELEDYRSNERHSAFGKEPQGSEEEPHLQEDQPLRVEQLELMRANEAAGQYDSAIREALAAYIQAIRTTTIPQYKPAELVNQRFLLSPSWRLGEVDVRLHLDNATPQPSLSVIYWVVPPELDKLVEALQRKTGLEVIPQQRDRT